MNPYIQYMYSYPHKTAYRPLAGVKLEDYLAALAGSGHGLYLHIPFCQSKCGYCNLFSVTGQDTAAMDLYLAAVERQARQYKTLLAPLGTEFSSLTIGGGTPLLLSESQLERMFAILDECFSFTSSRELVVETAPNQTTEGKLWLLKKAGATRISMGIQSFSDEELRALRRSHRAGRARQALALLKSFDFPCINVDFIYGIPGQTVQSLLNSIKEALIFDPDEIFLYPLYVKHGAKLEREPGEGMVLDPKSALEQYRTASSFLREKGFRQDSMRRFLRRKGQRAYSECGFGTSLALGCGGRSYLGRLHFCTPYAITRTDCLTRLEEYEAAQDFTKISHGLLLSDEELKRRYVIRHLLIQPGLSLGRYEAHFGSQAAADFPLLRKWQEEGYAERRIDENAGPKSDLRDCCRSGIDKRSMYSSRSTGDCGPRMQSSGSTGVSELNRQEYLALTPAGIALSDYLGPQLMSPKVRQYMEEWEAAHG